MPLVSGARRMASSEPGKLPASRAAASPVPPGAAPAAAVAPLAPTGLGRPEIAEALLGLGLEGVLERSELAGRPRVARRA